MTAQQSPAKSREMEEATYEALNRGELVRVLADADTGRIGREELEEALDRYSKGSWLRRFLSALFSRRRG